MLNLSPAQTSTRKSRCVSAKLSALSLDTSHFDKNMPRVMRVKTSMAVAGKRKIKKRRAPESPVSPQQELATSPVGHVALGPWTGPYQMHPLSAASSGSGELLITLYVDELGSSHFTLEDALVTVDVDVVPLADSPEPCLDQLPVIASVRYELSATEKQLVRTMVEETARLRAAMWPALPPRKVSRLPAYERGAAHGMFGHTKALYNVQQPRGRSA